MEITDVKVPPQTLDHSDYTRKQYTEEQKSVILRNEKKARLSKKRKRRELQLHTRHLQVKRFIKQPDTPPEKLPTPPREKRHKNSTYTYQVSSTESYSSENSDDEKYPRTCTRWYIPQRHFNQCIRYSASVGRRRLFSLTQRSPSCKYQLDRKHPRTTLILPSEYFHHDDNLAIIQGTFFGRLKIKEAFNYGLPHIQRQIDLAIRDSTWIGIRIMADNMKLLTRNTVRPLNTNMYTLQRADQIEFDVTGLTKSNIRYFIFAVYTSVSCVCDQCISTLKV